MGTNQFATFPSVPRIAAVGNLESAATTAKDRY